MGVMSCSKDDCTNILCDTYIQGVGYICTECQQDFKTYLICKELHPKTENEITDELIKFINIPKSNNNCDSEMSIDDFFNCR